MSLDPVKLADTREWFSKARDDIRSAEALLGATPPLYDEVSFHCQQAIEKTLKGFLFWHNEPFQKTHDLNVIGGRCCAIDPSLQSHLRRAAPLTQYAVEYRYPGPLVHPSRADVEQMIGLAKEVLEEILSRMPEAVAP